MNPTPPVEMLFDSAACGLLLTETDGTIKIVNQTFCQWLGYESEELINKVKIQQLFTMGGRLFHHTHWSPLLQMQGSVAEVQINMLHKQGDTLPMLVNAVRRKHGDEIFDELAVIIVSDRKLYEKELLLAQQSAERSLSELQIAQAQLKELNEKLSLADRRKDEFLATLAHELRNPMAPIRNVLEILTLSGTEDPQLNWALGVLSRQTEHMTHLIDDLLDVSRITHGRVILRKRRLDFAGIIRDVLSSSKDIVEAAGHQIEQTLPDEPVMIDADPVRINQIVSNLLNNASKYTPAGGHIFVKLTLTEHTAELRIRDSGIGISESDLARVFNMFSQLSPGLERAQGGLGIGLALARGLAELHGGRICAESEGLGKGSTFIVTLPVSASSPQSEHPADTVPTQSTSGLRILVIDDNADASETLAMALSMFGYKVSTAGSGLSGFDSAREQLPDAILLDIGLPDVNGYEIARRIRRESWGAGPLLIAVTGWGQDSDIESAREAGFDHHLTKPVNFDQLIELLERRTQGT